MNFRQCKEKRLHANAITVIMASVIVFISSLEVAAGDSQNREVKDFKKGKTESESTDKKVEARRNAEKRGVLGILSGKVKGIAVASTDIFDGDAYTAEIDGILLNVGNLKPAIREMVNRMEAPEIGFSEQGDLMSAGSIDDVEDLVGSIINSDIKYMGLKIRDPLTFESPRYRGDGSLTSERNRSNILLSIVQNLPGIKYAYGKRLREKSGLKGSITIKFAIDEFGKVIFCSVVNSTIRDQEFMKRVVRKIKRWKFERVEKPGDVSEVVYTFLFS